MYIPELYLALIIGGWLIDSAAKKRRKAAKKAAKAAAARKPLYTTMSDADLRKKLAQPTVWGPDKPWKTEAQYANALQVAQWDKVQRLAASA